MQRAFTHLFLILFCGILWIDSLSAADGGEFLSFDISTAEGGVTIAQSGVRRQSSQIVENGGNKFLKVNWNSEVFPYMEIVLNKPLRLPEFAAAKAKLSINVPQESGINSVGLRLLDSSNEVFQFSAKVDRKRLGKLKAGQTETQILEYEISNRTVQGSWGGNNNKVLDMPVRFFGFGLDYLPKSGAGDAALGKVEIEALPDTRVKAYFPFYKFATPEGWLTQFPGGTGKVSTVQEGLLVESKAAQIVLRETKSELIARPRFNALRLKAELIEGEASVEAVVQGQHGKRATTPAVKLNKGSNDILLDATGKDFTALSAEMRLVALKFKTPLNNASIRLSQFGCERLLAPLEAVSVDIKTGNPIHVICLGSEEKFSLEFANNALKPVSFTASVKVKPDFGKEVKFQKDFNLIAGEVFQWKPDFEPDKFGLYRLRCDIVEQGQLGKIKPLSINRNFAYMKPAGPTQGLAKNFLFSICTHTERWSEGEQEIEVLAAGLCGAKVMRVGPAWTMIEPRKGEYRWDQMDRLVKLYGDKGMELQYIFMFPPRWAAPENLRKSTNWKDIMSCAPESQAWKDFVKAMCSRYKGKVRFWEIWNEPDLNGFARFSSSEYTRLLKEAYQSAKEVDPEAKIMTGGFATLTPHGGRSEFDFQKNALTLGKGYFDIHAYHEHGTFDAYAKIIDNQFLPLRRKTGADAVPWYANETAIDSLWVGEKGQAETLFKKLIFAWSRGAIGYTWYDLRNDGFSSTDPEHHFGLLTNDFYPKPVYVAYNALAGEYASAKFIGELKGDKGLWAFEFKGDSDILIASWRQKQSAAENLLIKTDAKVAEYIDLMGNKSGAGLYKGYALVEYNTTPSTLRLLGATKIEAAGSLVSVDGSLNISAVGSSKMKIRLHNPYEEPMQFRLSIVAPSGVKSSHHTLLETCAARSDRLVEVVLTPDQKLKSEYGKAYDLRLGYAVDNAKWHGSLQVGISYAVTIAKRGVGDQSYDFILNSNKQLVSLYANDPNSKHLLWSGVNDLQAKVRLGCTDDKLNITVVVDDDRYNQPFAGADMWKGDSMQFGLQKEGAKGYWEIGLSAGKDSSAAMHVWSEQGGESAKKLVDSSDYSVLRTSGGMVYNISMPLSRLGLSRDDMGKGIRFNLLVNDNDEGKREGWLEIAPHLGQAKNPALFPLVIFR